MIMARERRRKLNEFARGCRYAPADMQCYGVWWIELRPDRSEIDSLQLVALALHRPTHHHVVVPYHLK